MAPLHQPLTHRMLKGPGCFPSYSGWREMPQATCHMLHPLVTSPTGASVSSSIKWGQPCLPGHVTDSRWDHVCKLLVNFYSLPLVTDVLGGRCLAKE